MEELKRMSDRFLKYKYQQQQKTFGKQLLTVTNKIKVQLPL